MAAKVVLNVLQPGARETEMLLKAARRYLRWGAPLDVDGANTVTLFFVSTDDYDVAAGRVKYALDQATTELDVGWWDYFKFRKPL